MLDCSPAGDVECLKAARRQSTAAATDGYVLLLPPDIVEVAILAP